MAAFESPAFSTRQTSLYDIVRGSQQSLPNLKLAQPIVIGRQRTPVAELAPPAEGFKQVIPGQLSFGPAQEELTAQQRPGRQLALLPDPPPWEMDPGPPSAASPVKRLARKRRRLGISAGQQSLF